jgi:hypothetical protein
VVCESGGPLVVRSVSVKDTPLGQHTYVNLPPVASPQDSATSEFAFADNIAYVYQEVFVKSCFFQQFHYRVAAILCPEPQSLLFLGLGALY